IAEWAGPTLAARVAGRLEPQGGVEWPIVEITTQRAGAIDGKAVVPRQRRRHDADAAQGSQVTLVLQIAAQRRVIASVVLLEGLLVLEIRFTALGGLALLAKVLEGEAALFRQGIAALIEGVLFVLQVRSAVFQVDRADGIAV